MLESHTHEKIKLQQRNTNIKECKSKIHLKRQI